MGSVSEVEYMGERELVIYLKGIAKIKIGVIKVSLTLSFSGNDILLSTLRRI